MPVYVSLLRFTQQGVEAVKEQGSRMDRMKDDAAAAAFCLAIMSKGNVRSETMRAFEEAEYREILGNLPS